MVSLSPKDMQLIFKFAGKLGVKVKNPLYLYQALIHRSYANEIGIGDWQNERLEFLGDSVLGFAITFLLYNYFPLAKEGELTKYKSELVSAKTLAKIALEFKLQDFIRLGKGERNRKGGVPVSILSSAYEAALGGLFLDLGYRELLKVIKKHFNRRLQNVKNHERHDPKGDLQQQFHKIFRTAPCYHVVRTDGPPHNRIFYVEVMKGKKVLGEGSGSSKREAEQQAAQRALDLLEQPPYRGASTEGK